MHFLKGSKSHHSVPVLRLSLWSPGLCPRRWDRAGGGRGGRVSRGAGEVLRGSVSSPPRSRRPAAHRLSPTRWWCKPGFLRSGHPPMPGMPLARNQSLNLLLRKNGGRPIVSVNGKKNQVSPLASRRDM